MSKDAKATTYLHSTITETIFPRIVNATSSKQIWGTLQEEFQGSNKARAIKLQNLRRDFENLKMKDSESVKEYSSRMMEIINQMKIYGEAFFDKRIVDKIIRSRDKKFNFIVTTIEESKDLDKLSPTELLGSLQAHERKVTTKDEGATKGAFQTRHKQMSKNLKNNKKKQYSKGDHKPNSSGSEKKGGFSPCGICKKKKKNHSEKNCLNNDKSRCGICKKFGHEENDCWHKDQNAKANVTSKL